MNKPKPKMSLFLAYSTIRERLTAYLNQTLEEYPIPSFLVEGILNGMLADIRSKVIVELSGEHNMFEDKLNDYYEQRTIGGADDGK